MITDAGKLPLFECEIELAAFDLNYRLIWIQEKLAAKPHSHSIH